MLVTAPSSDPNERIETDDSNVQTTSSDIAPMEVQTTEPTPSVKPDEEEAVAVVKEEERDPNMETSITIKEEQAADSSKEVI